MNGYDERSLLCDNSTDNLPTCRRVKISVSYVLLLGNTAPEHKRWILLARIMRQGKDEKHWLTSTAGTPPAPLTWLWDVKVLYLFIIHREKLVRLELDASSSMLAKQVEMYTRFCKMNTQMATWNAPIMHYSDTPVTVVQKKKSNIFNNPM